MRVLIADDEPGSRLLLAAAIQKLGHECIEAEDGARALELFRAELPEVVITDWDMPGLDGTALAKAIRSEPEVPYAYVVVLTGQAGEAAARDAMEAGADDLVLKPLDPAALERKLIAAERMTGLHRRMHGDARQDPLTGVGNRLRLAEDVKALCGRVERYGHSYCVALFDIDNFKAFNDGVGHLAGDDVLRAVADALSGAIRSGDTLYRYGGEEFLVLLAEQSLDRAAVAGERLRAAVEELNLRHPDGSRVTVSAGVAGLGSASCSPDQLFALADQALYRAKQAGRNRVETAVPPGQELGEPAVRLLIADDDEAIRLAMSALAERHEALELVGVAADAEEAIALARERRPDVVLLDVTMPGGGGVAAANGMREALPDLRIVVLSAHEGPDVQLDMTRAGAIGYLVKGASDEQIVHAVRSAARW